MNIAHLVPAVLLLATCGQNNSPPTRAPHTDRDSLIAENRDIMRLEERDIKLYIERHGLAPRTTGTGVRFQFFHDEPGPVAKPDQLVTVAYRVELIDGRECYASDPGAPESFRVEHDDVESGLHEAIQLMSAGDSALVIIPSHRAHGLAGDMNKIPMRSTIIYRIGLKRVTG